MSDEIKYRLYCPPGIDKGVQFEKAIKLSKSEPVEYHAHAEGAECVEGSRLDTCHTFRPDDPIVVI